MFSRMLFRCAIALRVPWRLRRRKPPAPPDVSRIVADAIKAKFL